METTRRGFFVTIAAAAIASKLPMPEAVPLKPLEVVYTPTSGTYNCNYTYYAMCSSRTSSVAYVASSWPE